MLRKKNVKFQQNFPKAEIWCSGGLREPERDPRSRTGIFLADFALFEESLKRALTSENCSKKSALAHLKLYASQNIIQKH